MKLENFVSWLKAELKRQNITQSELAIRSGMSAAQISRIVNLVSPPSHETLAAIASGLHKPVEQIYRIAGVLPTSTDQDELQKNAIYLFDTLKDAGNKQRAVDFLEFLHLQEEKGTNAAPTPNNEVLKPRR